jgi:hypothetical protein
MQCALASPRVTSVAVGTDDDGEPACIDHALPETVQHADRCPEPPQPLRAHAVKPATKIEVVQSKVEAKPEPAQAPPVQEEHVKEKSPRKPCHAEGCDKQIFLFNKSGYCAKHFYFSKLKGAKPRAKKAKKAKPAPVQTSALDLIPDAAPQGGFGPTLQLTVSQSSLDVFWHGLSFEQRRDLIQRLLLGERA